jgi:ubiquinone biosynthesis protein UbiJ
MRSVLGDVNRGVPFGRHLEEFRADMKSLERKVEQLEAKITTFKAEGGS